jgi:hypothetical protein
MQWFKKAVVAATLLCLVVAAGCIRRLTDFTVISTRNVDLSRLGECRRYPQRVRGRHSVATCLGGALFASVDMKTSIDRALDKVPGSVALIDGVIYQSNWSFLDLFGGQSIIVEGTPLIDEGHQTPRK